LVPTKTILLCVFDNILLSAYWLVRTTIEFIHLSASTTVIFESFEYETDLLPGAAGSGLIPVLLSNRLCWMQV
jgi:hypothetical protein